jgi:hypothetical protein
MNGKSSNYALFLYEVSRKMRSFRNYRKKMSILHPRLNLKYRYVGALALTGQLRYEGMTSEAW